MNPYDPCVWNKIINEKQTSVAAIWRDINMAARRGMYATGGRYKDGEVQRVNLSSIWTRSTDALLLPALDEDETSTRRS